MSYLKKMFINNLGICLAYMLLFSILMYIFTLTITTNQIDNNLKSVLSQTSQSIDNGISKALDLSIMINENPYIRIYANENTPDYYNRIQVLSFLRNSIGYLPSKSSIIAVMHENDNGVITNDFSMPYRNFAETIGLTPEELDALKTSAKTGGNTSVHYTFSNNSNSGMLTIIACERNKYRQPLYVFACLQINEMLPTDLSEDIEIIISIDNTILYTTGNVSDNLINTITDNKPLDNKHIFIKNSSAASFLGNLTYYTALSNSSYRQKLAVKFIFPLIILLILMILSLIAVYFMTKRTYAPIVGLLDAVDITHPDKDKNEIDYIKNKILSLSNNNKQLTNTLNNYRLPLEEALLKDMLYGILPQQVCEERIRHYGSAILSKSYVTAIIETHESQTLLYNAPADSINVLNKTVISMFTEHFSGYAFFRILLLTSDKYAIIASVNDFATFRHDLQIFLLKTGESTGINLFASVGTMVNGLSNINQSFSVALNVSENRIHGRQYSTICTADDVDGFKDNGVYYPFDMEASIIENVLNSNTQTLHHLTSTLISANFVHKPFSQDQFSQFVFMFTSTFNRIFSALNIKPADIFGEDTIIYLELRSCREPNELLDKINSLLDQIANSLRSQISSMDTVNREHMLNFIENNYSKDISLIDLAEYMNFSSVHTSRLFKALVGQNFKEYLTHYRYEKAKELMVNSPHMKIKEIATAVGCNSTAALSRIFMKCSGISPGQYMKNISHSNNN